MGTGFAGPYKLPAQFLIVNSDSVVIAGEYLSRDRYRLNYETGEIAFLEPVAESTEVLVYFQTLPFKLAGSYRHKELVPQTAPAASPPQAKPPRTEGETNLYASGTKIVGVNLSSQGPVSLEQSLRLNLKGELAGLELEAYLSDQQTPIPPEGTTRELSQLDQILIKLNGKNLSGSLGDCALSLPLAQFGMIERKLAGGMGGFNLKGLKMNFATARSKGKFTVNRFPGEDGKQGPYFLQAATLFTIVPGSEIVYLDGERLVRGWDGDYLIDYSAAQLTFTNRRLITNRSRIEVEFEYTTEFFERFVYNLGSAYDIAPVSLGLQLFQESDDPNRSLQYDLTPAQRSTLALIGDDTSLAWVPADTYVGPGNGNYTREGDHFRYAGANLGDYNVSFSYAGDNQGDYDYDNATGAYSYVGTSQGRYRPSIFVDLPKKNELLLTSLKLDKIFGFSGTLTGLATREDQNLFSSKDDGDNGGLGYALRGGWEFKPLALVYERSYFGSNLWLAPRSEDVDFQHTWGITPLPGERSIDQLNVSLQPVTDLIFNLGGGLLATPHVRAQRGYFEGRFRNSRYGLQYLKSGINHNLALSLPLGMFVPQINFNREGSDTGRFWNGLVGGEITLKKPLSFGLSYERRDDDRNDSLWLKESQAETYRLSVNSRLGGAINLTGVFGLHKKHHLQVAGTDFENYFATVRSSYTHPRGISARLDIDQTQKQTQGQVVNYIKVEKGTGEYSRDPETGNFYYDPAGDYIRQTLPTGKPIPAAELNVSTSLDLSFLRPLGFHGFYTTTRNLGDTALVRAGENYNFDLTILPYEPRFSLSLLNSGTTFHDALSTEPTDQVTVSYGVEVRSTVADPVFLKARAELNRQDRERSGIGFEKKSTEQRVAFEPSLNLKANFLFRLGYGHTMFEFPLYYPLLGKFPLDRTNAGLSVQWSGLVNTLVGASVDINYRTSTVSQLPYELSVTEPLGFTPEWQLTGDRYLTDELTLSLQYHGLAYPDRPVDHTFSLSLRAYF